MNFLFYLLQAKSIAIEFVGSGIAGLRREQNTCEGSEFLDDAIRLKEQPLLYTETSIAVGIPTDLVNSREIIWSKY